LKKLQSPEKANTVSNAVIKRKTSTTISYIKCTNYQK